MDTFSTLTQQPNSEQQQQQQKHAAAKTINDSVSGTRL
jgi:hypothetical protein